MLLLSRATLLRSPATAAAALAARKMSSAAGAQVEARLAELGYVLPKAAAPAANYVMSRRVGSLVYTAGHLPQPAEGGLITGKVGSELTTEQGYDAARAVGLNILATLKAELGGDLGRVKQIVKVMAFVNCIDGFSNQPKVVNGCSDMFNAVLGEKGRHARSAVGTNSLPLNVPVEIECIVEVE
jgi:enamine deaminase RidA (YjgF/YER057c/UK114 family)